ncbi:MAG: ACP S-malonyltransferase [Gemmatimonadales bacterium]|jgi:[acyl-carrier-protein] S-malonyltransferase
MRGRNAFLLPGQGSQHVGMGSDLAESLPVVRQIYERADELLGLPLSEICREGPEDRLRRTENAQPAILVHSYAIWRALPERVRQGAAVAAGHSLGEFSAYLIADAISFDAALRLVRRRGELMAEAGSERPGTMSAVIGLEADRVAEVCREAPGIVVPANYNAPGQVVISGEIEAVEGVAEALREAGARRVIPLNVSGAFHSPLMEGARQELEEMLADTEIADPVFPVVANVSAEPVETSARARELLVSQLTGAVRWSEGILRIGRLGISSFIEIGPGSVLTGLLRRIDRGLQGRAVGDLESLRALAAE